ncbi:alcohol dehydrogenase catalytic domain-containing protein [Salmonella enterica]
MKTLICNNPGNIEYIERDIPHLKDDEVLLKIKAVGICGTDIHAFAGRQPFFAYPRVLGHEICGVAEMLGKSCSTAKVGQRYSVIPCIPCGACAACREGKPTAVRTSRCMAFTRTAALANIWPFVNKIWLNCRITSPTARARWLSVSPSAPMQYAALT